MEKKRKRYVLLGTVFIIWGLIGFQIYKQLNPKEEINTVFKIEEHVPITNQQKRENYIISEYSRDPFLGTIYKMKVVKNRIKPVIIVFPSIVYNGMVKGNKQTTYIITINNQQEILKAGQTYQDVKLLKGNSKEIKVRYKGAYKTFTLQ